MTENQMDQPSNEALAEAEYLIVKIKKLNGNDYSGLKSEIALFFDNVMWQGNWDGTLAVDAELPNLRFIQEDEYDQHMDECDDKPDYDLYACGHYVIFV